jgi:hypothetical protein
VKLRGGLTAATETLAKFDHAASASATLCKAETGSRDAVGLQCRKNAPLALAVGCSIAGASSNGSRASPEWILTVVNSDLKDLRGLRWRLRLRITFSAVRRLAIAVEARHHCCYEEPQEQLVSVSEAARR